MGGASIEGDSWGTHEVTSLVYGWLFFGAGKQHFRDLGFFVDGPEHHSYIGSPCSDDVLLEVPTFNTQCLRTFQVHWGALSIIAINAMMASITTAITVFQGERSCFLREASNGYYSTFAYYVSKTIFEIPVVLLTNCVSILTAKWIMGLTANPIILILELMLLSLASSSMVACLSAQANTPQQAYALSPIAMIPQLLGPAFDFLGLAFG